MTRECHKQLPTNPWHREEESKSDIVVFIVTYCNLRVMYLKVIKTLIILKVHNLFNILNMELYKDYFKFEHIKR